MSGSNRGGHFATLVLAIVLSWTVFTTVHFLRTQEGKPCPSDYATCKEYDKSKRSHPFGSIGSTEAAREKAYRDEYRSEQDLISQQNMASWAWWTMIAAWVGVVLIAATLYEALQTNAAAVDAIKTQREAAQRELRAYVFHETIVYISHRRDAGGGIFWRLRPIWRNTGNTPTRGLYVFVGFRLTAEPLPADFDFSAPADVVPRPATIPPRSTIQSRSIDIDGVELAAVKAGTQHLYVWGTAIYRDVFSDTPERISKFCVRAVNITGDPEQYYHRENNIVEIMWEIHHANNCVDEECAP